MEGEAEQKRIADRLSQCESGSYAVCESFVETAEKSFAAAADAMVRCRAECGDSMERWLTSLERLQGLLQPTGSIFRSAPDRHTYDEICRAAASLEPCSRELRGCSLRFATVGELLTQAELCVPRAKQAIMAVLSGLEDDVDRARYDALLRRLNACEVGGGALKQRLYGQRLAWSEFCNNDMTRFLVGLQSCADTENDGARASVPSLRRLCEEIRSAAQRVL